MIITKHLDIVEQIHLHHFEFFPRVLGFPHCEKRGVQIINCGLGSSMFNIVYGRLKSAPSLWEGEVQEIIDAFKGQPFAWWVPYSAKSREFTESLLKAGLVIETTEHAMICDLQEISPPQAKTELAIQRVRDGVALEDFISVLEPYDGAARSFYERVSPDLLDRAERLFVGYVQNKPVASGILFEGDIASGIFSLLTESDARGKGYGTDMMGYLLGFAKARGSKYATLSASSDSGYRIYERFGFRALGEFACFEYKGKANDKSNPDPR